MDIMQQEKPHNFKVANIWFNITIIYFLPAFFAYIAKYCCFKFALTCVVKIPHNTKHLLANMLDMFDHLRAVCIGGPSN